MQILKNAEAYWKERFKESAALGENHKMSISSKVAIKETRKVFTKILSKYYNYEFKTILDVGCGPGTYFDIFSQFDLEIYGLDFSPEQLLPAKEKFPAAKLYEGRLEDNHFENKFDIITAIGVVQTVDNLTGFLQTIKDNLLDNGMAIITFSDKDALYPKGILNAPYLNLYSLNEARSALEKFFKIIEYRRIYYFPLFLNVFSGIFYKLQVPRLNHSIMFVLGNK